MLKASKIVSVLVGIFLLVSAYAKSADAAYFSNLLTFYGHEWLGWLAPAVIAAELVIGLLLFLQIRVRHAAWTAAGFVVLISLVYAYGVAFHGVYNCGCFGHLEFLNFAPAWTFVRNIILFGLLLFVALKGEDNPGNPWTRSIAAIGLIIGMFTVGMTFTKSTVMLKGNVTVVPTPISETAIPRYVHDMSPDSTYLLFAFSYSCPYCNQSIGNVAMFEQTGTVDRVIGLVVDDTIAEKPFRAFYKEEPFEIRRMPVEAILDITHDQLPTSFLVRHDTIFVTSHNEMFSPRFVNGFNPNN